MAGLEAARARDRKGGRKPVMDQKKLALASKMLKNREITVGGYEAVKEFLPRLQLAHRAANLGTVETTVGPPATTSHVESSAREREAMDIPESLVRYSTGIEHAEDLISDLEAALSATRA